MTCCSSCGRAISGAFPDVRIVVERNLGEPPEARSSAFYCTTCAPSLVGLGDSIEDARVYRNFIATTKRTRRS